MIESVMRMADAIGSLTLTNLDLSTLFLVFSFFIFAVVPGGKRYGSEKRELARGG